MQGSLSFHQTPNSSPLNSPPIASFTQLCFTGRSVKESQYTPTWKDVHKSTHKNWVYGVIQKLTKEGHWGSLTTSYYVLHTSGHCWKWYSRFFTFKPLKIQRKVNLNKHCNLLIVGVKQYTADSKHSMLHPVKQPWNNHKNIVGITLQSTVITKRMNFSPTILQC